MLNSLGMFAYFQGRWNEALELYGQAQERARRVGNLVQFASYENNVAEIALDQGRIEEAEHLFESVSRSMRAAGFRAGAAYVNCNLGRCAAESGRFEEAMQRFKEAQLEEELLGGHAEMVEIGARWAEAELLAGDVDAARSGPTPRSSGPGRWVVGTRWRYSIGCARSHSPARGARCGPPGLAGQPGGGAARHMDFELALTLKIVAELGIDCDGEGPDAAAAESRRLLETLGVQSSPDLLVMATASG